MVRSILSLRNTLGTHCIGKPLVSLAKEHKKQQEHLKSALGKHREHLEHMKKTLGTPSEIFKTTFGKGVRKPFRHDE